jgi:uncharacterized protein with von Willebrand factor type A (vWA) domain
VRFKWMQLLSLLLIFLWANPIGFTQTQPQGLNQPTGSKLSLGIVADNSGSLRLQMGSIRDATIRLINAGGADDRMFLVRFVDRKATRRMVDLTSDKNELINAADDMFVEGGETAIIDAVLESAQYLAQNSAGPEGGARRALVLMTDGEDRASKHKAEELEGFLREKGIKVFVIRLPERFEKGEGNKVSKRALTLINGLASASGGQAFFPRAASDLERAINEVSTMLHQ